MTIAYSFDKSKLQDGEGYPGVPRASLTQEQFDALPAYLQAAVEAHPAWRKRSPAAATDEAAAPATAPDAGKE